MKREFVCTACGVRATGKLRGGVVRPSNEPPDLSGYQRQAALCFACALGGATPLQAESVVSTRLRVRFVVERDDGGESVGYTPLAITERFDTLYGDWEHVTTHYDGLYATRREAWAKLREARAAHALATGLQALGAT